MAFKRMLAWILLLNAILALAACTSPTPTATPEVMTATQLSPEENMEKYGIPAVSNSHFGE